MSPTYKAVALLVILLTSGSLAVAQETTSAPRLAVLPFGWEGCPFFPCPERAAFITNMVEEALFRTGRYRLVDRRALLAILQEQGLSGSQLASPQAATTVGKLTGAQALVLGNLDRFSSEFLGYFFQVPLYQATVGLTARAVRTEDGEILAIVRSMKTNRGTLEGGLATRRLPLVDYTAQQAVEDLVQQLDQQLQSRLRGR
jgi:hypothetical protein